MRDAATVSRDKTKHILKEHIFYVYALINQCHIFTLPNWYHPGDIINKWRVWTGIQKKSILKDSSEWIWIIYLVDLSDVL